MTEQCKACKIIKRTYDTVWYEKNAHGGFKQHHALILELTKQLEETRIALEHGLDAFIDNSMYKQLAFGVEARRILGEKK